MQCPDTAISPHKFFDLVKPIWASTENKLNYLVVLDS